MKNHAVGGTLQQILDGLRLPVMVSAADGTELYCNRAWTTMRKALQRYVPQLSEDVRAVGAGAPQRTLGAERFSVTTFAVAGENGEALVVSQLSATADADALQKRLDDAAQITASYQEKLATFGERNYIATSDQMIRIFTKAKQVAIYPTSIMILGETGVGKEVLSSFIHHNSDRAGKPFIKINCSAIPEPLMESELFGYEGGAFTGARDRGKAGLFELANHGTILLDEIGDMALPMQAKLLRVIQDEEIRRVGGSKPIALDVRIISATSRDLEEMVAEGRFLDALYYRLNVVEMQIPPLRERREDILPLAEYYLQYFCEKYKLTHQFSARARESINLYDWPGNVRELRNTVENLTVSTESATIDESDLPARLTGGEQAASVTARMAAGESDMRTAVENLQRHMITQALQQHGSLRKAAAVLDMDPTTLHRLTKKLDIEI